MYFLLFNNYYQSRRNIYFSDFLEIRKLMLTKFRKSWRYISVESIILVSDACTNMHVEDSNLCIPACYLSPNGYYTHTYMGSLQRVNHFRQYCLYTYLTLWHACNIRKQFSRIVLKANASELLENIYTKQWNIYFLYWAVTYE